MTVFGQEINAEREAHGKKPFDNHHDDDQNGSTQPVEEKNVTESTTDSSVSGAAYCG